MRIQHEFCMLEAQFPLNSVTADKMFTTLTNQNIKSENKEHKANC